MRPLIGIKGVDVFRAAATAALHVLGKIVSLP
jgi:hypothetical protein